MSIESLKEKARRHEQKEDWEKALDLYLQAIRKLDQEEEEQDVSLFNRVGDLEVRLGQVQRAVQHYERAVDLYVEAELPNNAIAVCKKVVRNVPERDAIYLKMGQIRGQQGFLTDARQNFLAYAERKQAAGDLEEAFRALIEFVELAPEDIEIRLALASQLAQHERTEEAVEQFQEARRRLIVEGREEEAAEVEEQILELDPEADLPDAETIEAEAAAAEPVASADPWGAGFSDFGEGGAGEEEEEEEKDLSPMEMRKSRIPGAGEAEKEELVGDEDFVVGGLEGLDITTGEEEEAARVEAGESEEEGAWVEPGEDAEEVLAEMGEEFEGEGWDEEEWGSEEDWEDEEEAAPLPMMDFGDEEDEAVLAPGEEEEGVGTEEDEESEPVPTLDLEEEEEEDIEAVEPLPGLELDTEEPEVHEVEAPSGEEAREEALEEATFEERAVVAQEIEEEEEVEAGPEELREEGERLLDGGEVDEAWPLLEEAHQRFADRGDVEEALEIVGRMTEERPNEVPLHQRRVEYAYRMFDDEVLKEAYLGLARALRESGDTERARGVYRQVLETDPEDEAAQRALAELSGGEAPATPAARPEVASSEEYVDLGAMILEDEEEKTTRFVVPAGAPSGDEAADFQKMLSQFKEKVAENLETDDVASHYDLGTAYKEMGLVDEAISEFQAALRAAHGHLPTYEMLGQCFLEKGQNEAAVRTLERALEAPHEIEDELLGIYYYLGRAHEELGREEEALDFYDKVFALDINFMDVTERLRELR
ncbi:MAG: tetratricopeptide repeat protein [Longimicrobiales bacterium]|nr:tetratricopeptide repeat protein [Longimicrobiales bacterium]